MSEDDNMTNNEEQHMLAHLQQVSNLATLIEQIAEWHAAPLETMTTTKFKRRGLLLKRQWENICRRLKQSPSPLFTADELDQLQAEVSLVFRQHPLTDAEQDSDIGRWQRMVLSLPSQPVTTHGSLELLWTDDELQWFTGATRHP